MNTPQELIHWQYLHGLDIAVPECWENGKLVASPNPGVLYQLVLDWFHSTQLS
jgi:hypothetical protein